MAARFDDRTDVLRNAPGHYQFETGSHGYGVAESKLVAGRMASMMDTAKSLSKERIGELLTPQPANEDFMATLEQGDREAMCRSYSARNNNRRIDPENQGSDHFLALLKRALNRGEFPVVQLKQIVPFVPEQGELHYQRRHHREKGDSYVEEAIKEPAELEKWKRTMMVWRSSLLMAVAVCQN